MIHTCLGTYESVHFRKRHPSFFEFKMSIFRGVTAGTWTCSPLEKGKKHLQLQLPINFWVPSSSRFCFPGSKSSRFSVGELRLPYKPPNSAIFPDSYFPTSQVLKLIHWRHDFGLIPIMVVRWNIILKWTNRSKFHKPNGWDLPTKKMNHISPTCKES